MAASAQGRQIAALHNAAGERDARNAYAQRVRAILEREKRYPRRAKARGRQGVVAVAFTVDRQGRVTGAKIKAGSGVTSLDRETMAMLRRADLPPLPRAIRAGTLSFVMPVTFTLR